jgi:hypothetical protein
MVIFVAFSNSKLQELHSHRHSVTDVLLVRLTVAGVASPILAHRSLPSRRARRQPDCPRGTALLLNPTLTILPLLP